jgi:glycolate oxidase iron-sulfur subunit
MQTSFTLAQLADPEMQAAEKILRTCVHCGFCTATCPTYLLLGDENDSPRGRIYLIKDMLENGGKQPEAAHVRHVDSCLSCLSCMTTCPSGVHYMHLVDTARTYIEEKHQRPLADRLMRRLLGWLLPSPTLFRLSLIAAAPVKLIGGFLPGRLGAMARLTPSAPPPPSPVDLPQIFPSVGPRKGRVALLSGCAQQVLAPQINEATVRLLTRLGVEVVVAKGAGCCGALNHHLGQHDPAVALMKANVAAWSREIADAGLDAIVINASGCGTTVKDYGHMLRADPDWADRAAKVAGLAKDISEYLHSAGLIPDLAAKELAVTYHSACSLQHGQKITSAPKALLQKAGFTVADVPEGHICCGSAGTYNLLQPEIAVQLRDRKLANIATTKPDVIAAGNIGCMTQIASAAKVPVVHTVELLDWATGGPKPQALA